MTEALPDAWFGTQEGTVGVQQARRPQPLWKAALIRVLICDDVVAFSSLVTHWVSDCPDLEVVGTADSGTELLQMLEPIAPDVVVLDHLLHDVANGSVEITPQIRAKLPSAGVVLVSGMPQQELERLAALVGADAFVRKGTSPETLCDCIREAARKRRYLPDEPPLAA